jgi:hypothetical protein
MMKLDLYNECSRGGGYRKTWLGVSWKVVGDRMYFQPSKERIDWVLNLLCEIPVPLFLGKWFFIVPLGAALGWLSVRGIVKKHPVVAYIGISQGGWWASYASAVTGLPAATFGCPNLFGGALWLGIGFDNVSHYETPRDIVARFPTWGSKGRNVYILNRHAVKPKGMPDIEWETGHTPEEYRQRMEP